MTGVVKQTLAGWGNYPREESFVHRPESTRDVSAILDHPSPGGCINMGLGRSYGDAALNRAGDVILHQRLNRLLHWDPTARVLECEGGASYQDILDTFLPRGFILPVTPGTRFVTIGGAIAADVHGKNHHRDGSIANFVASFQLLTGTGETLTCSREQNADVFWATFGGMGLTGAILSARLNLVRVESAYIGVDYQKAPNLDAALELFCADAHYHYSVAWIDCLASGASLGRSVLMRGDYLKAADLPPKLRGDPLASPVKRPKTVPFYFPAPALNSVSVRAFNELYFRRHRNGYRVVDAQSFFYPLDAVLHWNRIYGRRGFVQYQVVIPPQGSRNALLQILEKLSRSGSASFLAVLKTFGPGNEGLLSFPTAGATLALDLPFTGPALLELLDRLDQIVLCHGGRVYLAKDARLSCESFEEMYPRAPEFRRLKQRLDPKGVFRSSLARRLGLVDNERSLVVKDAPPMATGHRLRLFSSGISTARAAAVI
jgi:FAD/FMN-containing dehydrogenase